MLKKMISYSLVFFFTLGVVYFFKSKKESKKQEEKSENISNYEKQLPHDFHTFYDDFHTDSTFQMNRIIWPLQGMEQSADTTKLMEPKLWQANNWSLHRPFNDQGGTFERTFTNINGMVTEYITGNNGMFTIEKRYSKLSGVWHLIYYQDMVMLG